MTLDNLFPGGGIAPDGATDQQSDNLGFFQNRTPKMLELLETGCPPLARF
jgi:hypothetical protein